MQIVYREKKLNFCTERRQNTTEKRSDFLKGFEATNGSPRTSKI